MRQYRLDARRAVADRLVHQGPRQRVARDPGKRVRPAALQRQQAAQQQREGLIAEGLRYVWGNKIVLGAISLDLVVVLLAGAVIPLALAWIGDAVPYAERQATIGRFLTGRVMAGMAGDCRPCA